MYVTRIFGRGTKRRVPTSVTYGGAIAPGEGSSSLLAGSVFLGCAGAISFSLYIKDLDKHSTLNSIAIYLLLMFRIVVYGINYEVMMNLALKGT